MFISEINPERLKLLTSEQLKVVGRWDREAQERFKLITEICAANNSNDKEKAHQLADKFRAIDAEYCEHGRHKHSSHCIGCEEIERILFPEAYQDDE